MTLHLNAVDIIIVFELQAKQMFSFSNLIKGNFLKLTNTCMPCAYDSRVVKGKYQESGSRTLPAVLMLWSKNRSYEITELICKKCLTKALQHWQEGYFALPSDCQVICSILGAARNLWQLLKAKTPAYLDEFKLGTVKLVKCLVYETEHEQNANACFYERRPTHLLSRCWKKVINCGSSVWRLKVRGSHFGPSEPPTRLEMEARQSFTVKRFSHGNWFSITWGLSSLSFLQKKKGV